MNYIRSLFSKKVLISSIVVIAILFLVLNFLTSFSSSLKLILLILIFFFPGFFLVRIIWPDSENKEENIDISVRFLLSFLFSLIIVPTIVFMLFKLGVPFNIISITVISLIIIFVEILVLYFKNKKSSDV